MKKLINCFLAALLTLLVTSGIAFAAEPTGYYLADGSWEPIPTGTTVNPVPASGTVDAAGLWYVDGTNPGDGVSIDVTAPSGSDVSIIFSGDSSLKAGEQLAALGQLEISGGANVTLYTGGTTQEYGTAQYTYTVFDGNATYGIYVHGNSTLTVASAAIEGTTLSDTTAAVQVNSSTTNQLNVTGGLLAGTIYSATSTEDAINSDGGPISISGGIVQSFYTRNSGTTFVGAPITTSDLTVTGGNIYTNTTTIPGATNYLVANVASWDPDEGTYNAAVIVNGDATLEKAVYGGLNLAEGSFAIAGRNSLTVPAGATLVLGVDVDPASNAGTLTVDGNLMTYADLANTGTMVFGPNSVATGNPGAISDEGEVYAYPDANIQDGLVENNAIIYLGTERLFVDPTNLYVYQGQYGTINAYLTVPGAENVDPTPVVVSWSIESGSDYIQLTEGTPASSATVYGAADGQATVVATYTDPDYPQLVQKAEVTVNVGTKYTTQGGYNVMTVTGINLTNSILRYFNNGGTPQSQPLGLNISTVLNRQLAGNNYYNPTAQMLTWEIFEAGYYIGTDQKPIATFDPENWIMYKEGNNIYYSVSAFNPEGPGAWNIKFYSYEVTMPNGGTYYNYSDPVLTYDGDSENPGYYRLVVSANNPEMNPVQQPKAYANIVITNTLVNQVTITNEAGQRIYAPVAVNVASNPDVNFNYIATSNYFYRVTGSQVQWSMTLYNTYTNTYYDNYSYYAYLNSTTGQATFFQPLPAGCYFQLSLTVDGIAAQNQPVYIYVTGPATSSDLTGISAINDEAYMSSYGAYYVASNFQADPAGAYFNPASLKLTSSNPLMPIIDYGANSFVNDTVPGDGYWGSIFGDDTSLNNWYIQYLISTGQIEDISDIYNGLIPGINGSVINNGLINGWVDELDPWDAQTIAYPNYGAMVVSPYVGYTGSTTITATVTLANGETASASYVLNVGSPVAATGLTAADELYFDLNDPAPQYVGAKLIPDNTTVQLLPGDISYTTSDASVAIVSGKGVVEAVGEGTATITSSVTYYGVTYTATTNVTVAAGEPVEELTIDPSMVSLTPVEGGINSAEVTVLIPAGLTGDVTWASSASGVATVDAEGRTATITAVADGEAVITATVGEEVAECRVVVSSSDLIAADVTVTATSPDYYTVSVTPVPNEAMGATAQAQKVSIFTWSEEGQTDMDCKAITTSADGVFSYTFPVNDTDVNNYYWNADDIIINIYASTNTTSDGDMIAAGTYTWVNEMSAGENSVAYIGYQGYYGFDKPTVFDGATAGEVEGVRLEGVRISSNVEGVEINTEVHAAYIGWMGTVGDGTYAGTMHESRQIEAMRLTLSGENAAAYTIQYRVYQDQVGWSEWVSDGADAGVTGESLQMEAFEVQLVAK